MRELGLGTTGSSQPTGLTNPDIATVTSFLEKIPDGARKLQFRKGGRLFSQGATADSIHLVASGAVKVSVLSQSGKEAVLAIRGPNSILGEGCLLGQRTHTTTTTALESVTAYRVERLAILRALLAEPEFSEAFLRLLVERNIDLEEDLCDQLFNQSEKRLARALLKLAHMQDGHPRARITRLSHETLAEMVGTTRARVTLFMNRFRREGIIEYEGHASGKAFEMVVDVSLLTDVLWSE